MGYIQRNGSQQSAAGITLLYQFSNALAEGMVWEQTKEKLSAPDMRVMVIGGTWTWDGRGNWRFFRQQVDYESDIDNSLVHYCLSSQIPLTG